MADFFNIESLEKLNQSMRRITEDWVVTSLSDEEWRNLSWFLIYLRMRLTSEDEEVDIDFQGRDIFMLEFSDMIHLDKFPEAMRRITENWISKVFNDEEFRNLSFHVIVNRNRFYSRLS